MIKGKLFYNFWPGRIAERAYDVIKFRISAGLWNRKAAISSVQYVAFFYACTGSPYLR